MTLISPLPSLIRVGEYSLQLEDFVGLLSTYMPYDLLGCVDLVTTLSPTRGERTFMRIGTVQALTGKLRIFL